MTDHVPGPWHSKNASVVCFEGTRRIQIATTRQPIFTPEAQTANARLIAAAPDLLEACQRALAEAVADDQDEWFANMRAAIAKATGQTD